MIIAGTVGRECKCCLIKFALRSKIVCDSGAYQENQSRDRAGKLTFSGGIEHEKYKIETMSLLQRNEYKN